MKEITDETPIVMLTVGQLKELMMEILSIEVKESETKYVFNVEEAVEYLNSKGYKITKSGIYRHTMNGTIKFDRFGERKIVFKQEYLDEFTKGNLCK